MNGPRSQADAGGASRPGRTVALALALALVALTALIAYLGPGQPETHREAAGASAGAPARTPAGPQGVPAPAGVAGPNVENAWVVLDPESVDELPPYKEVVAGRALVRVSEVLRLGMGGGRIALHVPQLGTVFEGIVERAETDAYGNISYIGLLSEAGGGNFRFIITAGARNTFAHIGTSRGTYELVAGSELGWLMPTAGMDRHIDYSKPDYIIPEQAPAYED